MARRWLVPIITMVVGAIAIVALWLVRASGGVCVDGMVIDTGEFYGYCADYDSATAALPATIAIALLVVAGFFARRRILQFILLALIALAAIAGLIVNLTVIDYPEGYLL
jgi:hypothetical protein